MERKESVTEEGKVSRLGRRSWKVLEAGYAVGLVVVITEPPLRYKDRIYVDNKDRFEMIRYIQNGPKRSTTDCSLVFYCFL